MIFNSKNKNNLTCNQFVNNNQNDNFKWRQKQLAHLLINKDGSQRYKTTYDSSEMSLRRTLTRRRGSFGHDDDFLSPCNTTSRSASGQSSAWPLPPSPWSISASNWRASSRKDSEKVRRRRLHPRTWHLPRNRPRHTAGYDAYGSFVLLLKTIAGRRQ